MRLSINTVVLPAISLILAIWQTAYAQEPDTLWTRVYGGEGWDCGSSVVESVKGGYVITGATCSQPREQWDLLLIKTDYNGDTVWSRVYGGAGYDVGNSIVETYERDFVVAGETNSFGQGCMSIYLIKVNQDGDTIWTRTHSPGSDNWVFDIKQTLDSGYVMAGYAASSDGYHKQVLILKVNSAGELMWSKIYGGTGEDQAYSVCEVPGQGFVVTGYTVLPGQYCDLWLLRTDYNGDTVWTQTYGGYYSDIGNYIQRTADSGFIITGRTTSFGDGWWNVYLVKTDFAGNLEWYQVFGGSEWDGGRVVQQTTDGGYFVGGYTVSLGEGGFDFYFIKTNPDGSIEWSKTVGGKSDDWGLHGLQTSDGGYILVGNTWSFPQDDEHVYLVKLAPDMTNIGDEAGYTIPNTLLLEQNYPNPFNPSTAIRFSLPQVSDVKVKIYNTIGQLTATISEGVQQAGEHTIIWDASGFPSGVYFARLEVGEHSQNVKMVLLK